MGAGGGGGGGEVVEIFCGVVDALLEILLGPVRLSVEVTCV